MSTATRIARPLRFPGALAAALAVIITGCATTPPQTAAGSPASTAELRDMANFTKEAQNEGWTPEVRGGQVLYCMDESPMGSRLAERTCLDRTSLQQKMMAEELQRQAMQRPAAAGCGQPGSC